MASSASDNLKMRRFSEGLLNNLALLLKNTNRLSEAEPMFRRALAIWKASYGMDHPRVATGLSNAGVKSIAIDERAEAAHDRGCRRDAAAAAP